MSKIAVLTIAYNEEEWIGKCVEQFKPFGLKHLVLLSTFPWNGVPTVPVDRTESIVKEKGADLIVQFWPSEAEQRNAGLSLLYDYDYVLIVDADEFYDEDSIESMLVTLSKSKEPCYRIKEMVTYWKTPEYVLSPADKHQPIIAVNPKRVKFKETRQPMDALTGKFQDWQPVMEVTMHHHSWDKSDSKIQEKIQSYSHANIIPPNWYDEVWLKWEPGSDMVVHPYGREKSKAIKKV